MRKAQLKDRQGNGILPVTHIDCVVDAPNVVSERVVDDNTFEEFDKVTREELERGLFDKMWINAGGTKTSETTYGLNGLDDISFNEAMQIYSFYPLCNTHLSDITAAFARINNIRTLFTVLLGNASSKKITMFAFMNSKQLEVISLNGQIYGESFRMFLGCTSLKRIIGAVDLSISTKGQISEMFNSCLELESVEIKGLKEDFSLPHSPKLSYDSFQYLVANAANTTPITVKVHSDVYAKLTDSNNTEWLALNELALSKQITFATA